MTIPTGYTLATLRLGELMRADGYQQAAPRENQVVGELPWFGSIVVTEARLKEARARRDDAQVRLARATRDPEPVTS